MDLLVIIIAAVGVIFALLLARGMWLIGRGTDTELEARSRMANNEIGRTGWALLDWARSHSFGPVVWLEDKLGLEAPNERCKTHGCTMESVPGYQSCHACLGERRGSS